MYTVVRFCAEETCSDETLKEFGVRLNAIVPNSYEGRLDRIGRRFSIGVSRNADWTANFEEALQFVRKVLPLVEEVRASGVYVEMDTAIDSHDLEGRSWLTWGVVPEKMLELARAEICLAFTVYRGDSSP